MQVISDETNTVRGRALLRDAVKRALTEYLMQLNGETVTELYEMVIREVEEPLFEVILQYTNGNLSQSAENLGINRATLRKKLKKYQLY